METYELIRAGDTLQSSASRLAEFVLGLPEQLGLPVHVPYEVRMSALEAQTAVEKWTEARR